MKERRGVTGGEMGACGEGQGTAHLQSESPSLKGAEVWDLRSGQTMLEAPRGVVQFSGENRLQFEKLNFRRNWVNAIGPSKGPALASVGGWGQSILWLGLRELVCEGLNARGDERTRAPVQTSRKQCSVFRMRNIVGYRSKKDWSLCDCCFGAE